MDRKLTCVCIGLLLVCSFISCKQKSEVLEISESKLEKPLKDTAADAEDFDAFFKKFSRDSIFQKKRIKFPLKTAYYEDVTEDMTVHYLKETEITYVDFTRDALAMNKETDKYTFKIEKTANGIIYKRVGYDNGIHISYIFSLSENCWFLSEIIDEST